jgi:hypothetical protein
METITEAKIEDLEGKIDVNKLWQEIDLKNEVVVRDGDKFSVYVGEARYLWISLGTNVVGRAVLTRYDRELRMKQKKKVESWLPLIIKKEEVTVAKDKKIWSVDSSQYNTAHFVYDGKTVFQYRDLLKSRSRWEGVKLSDQLLELVYSPLDKQIMDWYQKNKQD